MEYFTINLLGLTLAEPNLFITDIVIACVAYICFIRLKTKAITETDIAYYRKFFLYTAISALISGFGHLLTLYTHEYLKMCGWIFSLLANFYITHTSVQYVQIGNKRTALNTIAVSKFVLSLGALLLTQKFIIVSIDTILSIACIALPIHFIQWKKTQKTGFKLFCVGVVFTMLTGIVSYFNISISEIWFNQKDINHLIICGGLLFIYKGVKEL
jgi:hypothetical protein